MKNKDMRRQARKLWRENWFTIFLSYIAGLLGYVLLTMLFSSLLNPFIFFTSDFSLGELRRGIGLSLTGILVALYFFVCLFYLIVLGFSFRKMLLEMSKGEKKVNAAMIFYGFHPDSFPLLSRMLGFSLLAFFFSLVLSLGQEAIAHFLGDGLWYWIYYAVTFVLLIFFSLFFDMTSFTIWEKDGKSLWQNMKRSAKVMKGQKFSYFRQMLFFSLATTVAVFLASMWSIILKSSILPVFVIFLYLSIYLIPYFSFVQTLIYRKGAGDSGERKVETKEEERAESKFSTVIAEDAEERSLAGAPFEPEQSTAEDSPFEPEQSTAGDSPFEPEQNIVEESPFEPEQNTAGDSSFKPEQILVKESEDSIKTEGAKDSIPESTTVFVSENTEPKPENAEADSETTEPKPKPDGKMSFEEARKQYTDYEE